MAYTSIVLSGERHRALFVELFLLRKESLEGSFSTPWPSEIEFLPDTEKDKPAYQRRYFSEGGTGWPARYRLKFG